MPSQFELLADDATTSHLSSLTDVCRPCLVVHKATEMDFQWAIYLSHIIFFISEQFPVCDGILIDVSFITNPVVFHVSLREESDD